MRGFLGNHKDSRAQERAEISQPESHRPYRTPSVNGGYFKNSLAALLALSAPELPPFFLPLVLVFDLLPLEPFFEVSPDFSRYFLPSFAILFIVRIVTKDSMRVYLHQLTVLLFSVIVQESGNLARMRSARAGLRRVQVMKLR